jgi:hypothetical protein
MVFLALNVLLDYLCIYFAVVNFLILISKKMKLKMTINKEGVFFALDLKKLNKQQLEEIKMESKNL